MKYDEVIAAVQDSAFTDYVSDLVGGFTFKKDVNIRIVQHETDMPDQVTSDWATNFPDKKAVRVAYQVYYCSSFITQFVLCAVDGFRACVPFPMGTSEDKIQLEWADYAMARAIQDKDRLDEYIRRCGFDVPDEPPTNYSVRSLN